MEIDMTIPLNSHKTAHSQGGELHSTKPVLKKGAAPLLPILAWFAALAFIGVLGYQAYKFVSNYREQALISEAISTAAGAAQKYSSAGASCTGFTLANAANSFDDRFVHSSGTITFPGGDLTMTATCNANAPVSSGSAPERIQLVIVGVDDNICIELANSLIDPQAPVDALSIVSGGSAVTVKNYRERIPSGRANIGVTACAPDTYSSLNIWLSN